MGVASIRRQYANHSRAICRQPRWKALRAAVLERDDWRCVQCGELRRLEVDHIMPVKTHPELAWDMGNLQILCGRCHSRKTRIEIGLGRSDPARDAWKSLVRTTRQQSSKEK